MDIVILAVLLVIGFIVAFAIGSNDETMSPAVGAKVFSLKAAVLLGAFINLIGAAFLGGGVSEKVGSDLVSGNILSIDMVLAILISMAIWLLVASSTKGLPISTTQCIVGSVIGVALVAPAAGLLGWGVGAIDWQVMLQIFLGWVVSPIIGFLISGVFISLIRNILRKARGFTGRERIEQIAAYGLAVFLIVTGLSRGGNDVANAVAPMVNLEGFQTTFNVGPISIPGALIPLIVGGLGMGLGLIVVGRKVIRTLATEVVTLEPTTALAASISVSLVMFIGTLLGFPLSGTHVLVAALIAVGYVAKTPVKMKQVRDILISWVVTVPISAFLGAMVFAVVIMVF
ncbi:inorganic phosphate transporter [Candidatus Thorarchaeota archaeon]|nr:MAG: inorganic phosphate transporter [Candidatus Thorarchaeota archaeon]